MKKILVIGLLVFISVVAIAQEREQSVIFEGASKQFSDNKMNQKKLSFVPGISKSLLSSFHSKKTRSGWRWYSYLFALDSSFGGNYATVANMHEISIWQDSTVKQINAGGAGAVSYSSFYDILDPTAPIFNGPFYFGEINIEPWNNYLVDTVVVFGTYLRPKGGNPDTLIISVVKNSSVAVNNGIFFDTLHQTSYPGILANNYVSGAGGDTSIILPGIKADSIEAIGVNPNQNYVVKKILTDADTSSSIAHFYFGFATPLAGEPNKPIGVTITFKSGNTWVHNVDTISQLNHFTAFFSEEQVGLAQEYMGNAPEYESNMSGLMLASDRSKYQASFTVELANNAAFKNELACVYYHVYCHSCYTGDDKLNDSSIVISVAPNPAIDKINFSIRLENYAKNVTLSLANTLGQDLRQINIGAVEPNKQIPIDMYVADLSSGLYFYTLKADGRKVSGKVQVR